MITYGSLCSGVEAASLAWDGLGFKPLWFSEIDRFPSDVLAHRWPEVPNLGDMTQLEERILSGEVHPPDVLVCGTPCQAFSIAGLRRSLADDRGNLTLVLVRILNAIDERRKQLGMQPCTIVWENVPGVLSTTDNAFGNFLAALAGEDVPLEPTRKRWTNAGIVFGHKRQIEWRIFDAQYFGVPQRRRRVFLVASSRDIGIGEILLERESMQRSAEKSGSTQEKSSAFIEGGFGGFVESKTAGTLRRSGGANGGGAETLVVHRVAATLSTGFGSRGLDAEQIANGNCVAERGFDGILRVRKLTPLECERLQGLPDNHTKIPYRGRSADSCPDGPRYKAIGNSMPVPVMRWIGQRLKEHMMNQQSGSNLTHSVLSASASARWSVCPASAYWGSAGPTDVPGMAAREGTGLHSLLEIALNTGKNADAFNAVPIPDCKGEIQEEPITEEQRSVLQDALDYVRSVPGCLETETRYFYGEELGVDDEFAFGTGDVTVIERNDFGSAVLHIMDLKTGRQPVRAERNTQLSLYAAGALRELAMTHEFDEVVLHVIQPRVAGGTNSWRTTPTEIGGIVESMKPSARKVIELVQEGITAGNNFEVCEDYYTPSDNCTFCKALAKPCPAQTKLAHDTMAKMFEEAELGGSVPVKSADDMESYELGDVLAVADILEPFFGAVREEAMRRAVTGGEVKGYKIVRARAGRKTWKSGIDVLSELAKIAPGINFTKPAEPRTVSDVLKMDTFKAKRGDDDKTKATKADMAEQLAELYEQGADARSLVPESDPRERWVPKVSSADDFEDLA